MEQGGRRTSIEAYEPDRQQPYGHTKGVRPNEPTAWQGTQIISLRPNKETHG